MFAAMRTNPMVIGMSLIAGEQTEIFRPVIGLDPVDVVDDFTGEEKTADHLLHDKPMLADIAKRIGRRMTGTPNGNITPGISTSSPPCGILGTTKTPSHGPALFFLLGFCDFPASQGMRKPSLAERSQTAEHRRLHFCLRLCRMLHSLARMGMASEKTILRRFHFRPDFGCSDICFHDMVYTMPNLPCQ